MFLSLNRIIETTIYRYCSDREKMRKEVFYLVFITVGLLFI